MAHTLLTYEERKIIEKRLLEKKSMRNIADELSRDHTVIGREVRRNSGEHLPYSADRAQLYATKRLKDKNKCIGKLEGNDELKEVIIKKLHIEWSPEQIGGWLKEQCKDPPGQISHETIYKYIYSPEGKEKKLWLHLRTGRHKRKNHGSRKKQCDRIPDRTSIHERPDEINEKTRYGDWESDTVESIRTGKGALSSHYERKSQACRLHKLCSKKAKETTEKLIQTKDSLPDHLFLTVTFDNGSENTEHTELKAEFGIETYFCDPYCSWQKGGVENLNKLIRQYFPKKTDFSKVSEEEIYEVQEKLNNRPRKSLNYRTPNQILTELTGGATNP
jgi:IS30 family transposase